MKVNEESEKVGFKLQTQKTKIIAFDQITSGKQMGEKMKTVTDFIFLGSKITEDWDRSHEIKDACSWEENYTKPRQCIKKQRHHFADKGPYTQSSGFSSGHVWMSELDHKEGWALKNWGFWTVVLDKTHESPLDTKESKPVNPKGNQLWIFFARTNIEAQTPIFWPPDVKSQLIGKDLVGMLGKIEGRRRRDDRRWDGRMVSMEMSLSKLWEIVKDKEVWRAAVHRVAKSWTRMSNWTASYNPRPQWLMVVWQKK